MLAVSVQTAQVGDAPDRLISQHGVELSNDGRVFVFFAALNALGYSVETERKGPPLEAPVFHPIRAKARDRLRKLASDGKLDAIRALLDKNPGQIDDYLTAILAHDISLKAPQAKLPAASKRLAGIVPLLARLGQDPGLVGLFDAVALEQRRLGDQLKGLLEKDFDTGRAMFKLKSFWAPLDLTVVVNPLDAHASVRRIRVGDTTFLVCGPGMTTARQAILEASLRPMAAGWAKNNYGRAAKLKRAWDGVKVSRRITRRFPDGQRYLSENLAQVMAYKILTKSQKISEDDFIDQQAKEGLRWTRALLRAFDGYSGGDVDQAMSKVIGKANP